MTDLERLLADHHDALAAQHLATATAIRYLSLPPPPPPVVVPLIETFTADLQGRESVPPGEQVLLAWTLSGPLPAKVILTEVGRSIGVEVINRLWYAAHPMMMPESKFRLDVLDTLDNITSSRTLSIQVKVFQPAPVNAREAAMQLAEHASAVAVKSGSFANPENWRAKDGIAGRHSIEEGITMEVDDTSQ